MKNMQKLYCGIGSQKTPISIGILQSKIAYKLAKQGWILVSGGAYGSDKFFEYGCDCAKGNKKIYIPQKEKYNNQPERNIQEAVEALSYDKDIQWDYLKPWTQLLFRRNVNQILLENNSLEKVKFVVYWIPILNIYKKEAGGTRIAARIAAKYNIQRFNLLEDQIKQRFEIFVSDVSWEPDINELWKRTELKENKQTSLFS